MNYNGIIVAIITLLIIGLFHPIVVKAEYYFSKNIWPLFLVLGLIFLIFSLFANSDIMSAMLAIVAASSFWSIKELFEQEKRVKKGWFHKREK